MVGEELCEQALVMTERETSDDVINGDAGDVTRCGIVRFIAESVSKKNYKMKLGY